MAPSKLHLVLNLLTIQLSLTHAFHACPFLGPDLPAATNVADSPAVQNATSILKARIDDGITSGLLFPNQSSFSVGIFSTNASAPLFEYHFSSPILGTSNGTKKVDSNSIYRIGSISKLFTVYTFLMEDGDAHFHEPITKYVPELLAASQQHPANNAANFVDWKSVTVGNLASQISGIGRDFGGPPPQELATEPSDLLLEFGLPPLNLSSFPPCTFTLTCDRKDFFAGFTQHHPVFAPSATPTYSNIAFQILSYALESITGKKFKDMLEADLISKLQLNGTTYSQPPSSTRGVIPGTFDSTGWDFDLGEETPAGGIYSTLTDLTALSRSILASSILKPAQTRRWLKPISHTANLQYSVGAPWEIWRLVLDSPSKVFDLYTKDGGIGRYTSQLTLAPDYGVGYVILEADGGASGQGVGVANSALILWINELLFPALKTAAREQAEVNYAGHYVSTDSNLNSSITIGVDADQPGLAVTGIISNGTDLLAVIGSQILGVPAEDVSLRLYPTILESSVSGGKEGAWRAVWEAKNAPTAPPLFGCESWGGVDAIQYGGVALDDFVFVTSGDWEAISVEARILRAVLKKV